MSFESQDYNFNAKNHTTFRSGTNNDFHEMKLVTPYITYNYQQYLILICLQEN